MSGPGLARTYSMSVVGIEGHLVDVETYAGSGLVAFTLVGLLDTSVREARDRVRAAFESCGLDVLDQRITVNLSPAGIPKSGSAFDLSIAASVALATGLVSPAAFEDAVIVGELGLDGGIQPVRGVLPAVLAARSRGVRRVIVPSACAQEARLVSGIEVLDFAHFADLVAWAGGDAVKAPFHGRLGVRRDGVGAEDRIPLDMADVRGQPEAVAALEVAAAGGHHVFLLGEPGSGKTMLASRLPTILPDLDADTALVTTSLHSVAGLLPSGMSLMTRPPFQAPHHSVTMPALIGGGTRMLVPGAASLAHGGILFLDEAAEFAPSVLDSLREPLESGVVHLHRSGVQARYPASFQLVMASNPCPCGGGNGGRRCTCSSVNRRRYLARLSGPLLDRMDIRIDVHTPSRVDMAATNLRDSASIRDRVIEARARARRRLDGTPWSLNAQLPGAWLRHHSGIDTSLITQLDRLVDSGNSSMRGVDRMLRLSWTLADLDGAPRPTCEHIVTAQQLRNGADHYE